MRKSALVVLSVVLAAALGWAGPPTATGVWLDQDVNYAFENCSATGSAVQVIPNGKYLMRVSSDEDVNIVYGTTYDGGASNNRPFPHGFGFLESFYTGDGGTAVACQSAGGAGDVYFTGTH